MNIVLAQINTHPGNIEANVRKITGEIRKASSMGADLIVFPELSITGYPPMDLLDSKKFIEDALLAVKAVEEASHSIAVIIGVPTINTEPKGKRLFNSAMFIAGGKTIKTYNKALLPTYDVFDEYRYFEPGDDFSITEWKNTRIAITICEDLWDEQPFDHVEGTGSLYRVSPIEEISKHSPDLVINISASPFAHNRVEAREAVFSSRAARYRVPVIMVNQTGANADLIFDGASLAIDSDGTIKHRLSFFAEQSLMVSIHDLNPSTGNRPPVPPIPSKTDLIRMALVTGIRDYLAKTGQQKVLIGLSGGIDSAVCAALATEALGSENVTGILMPSRYSSQHSVKDAYELAENLCIKSEKIEIEEPFISFERILEKPFADKEADITEENIQARIRAVVLMAYANKHGYLLLNTSNKSEAAAGYGTLYGDMAGALSVLGDVYKTDVYRLARNINRGKEIIPVSSITKPPSAELKDNQVDSDSLPPYDLLDQILFRFIEQIKDPATIIAEGFDPDTVNKVIALVHSSEYKRFQSPPVLRVSTKAFGSGRRIPLVSGYRY